MPDLILIVNGKEYGGWKEVRVRRSLEAMTPTFDLLVSDRWAGQASPWQIRPGDACQVFLDGHIVATGYVDESLPFFSATDHGIQVVGRGKTADLIDCSAVFGSGEWHNRKLDQIAVDLCKPFGIEVVVAANQGAAFKQFAIQEAETVFESLERLARQRGVFYQENAQGQLVVCTAGTTRIETALVQGENVKEGSGTFSLRDRYSEYICKGQAVGFRWSTPEQNASPSGRAEDGNVSRYRPLIILGETPGDNAKLKDRAIWEAAVRMGRSARPVLTVAPGWTHQSGLWLPNQVVACQVPYMRLDRDMLIASCTWIKDSGGSRTEIELVRPEAFDRIAIEEQAEKSLWG